MKAVQKFHSFVELEGVGTGWRWGNRLNKLPVYVENVERCGRYYEYLRKQLNIKSSCKDGTHYVLEELDAFHEALERMMHEESAASCSEEEFVGMCIRTYTSRIAYVINKNHRRVQEGWSDQKHSPEREEEPEG